MTNRLLAAVTVMLLSVPVAAQTTPAGHAEDLKLSKESWLNGSGGCVTIIYSTPGAGDSWHESDVTVEFPPSLAAQYRTDAPDPSAFWPPRADRIRRGDAPPAGSTVLRYLRAPCPPPPGAPAPSETTPTPRPRDSGAGGDDGGDDSDHDCELIIENASGEGGGGARPGGGSPEGVRQGLMDDFWDLLRRICGGQGSVQPPRRGGGAGAGGRALVAGIGLVDLSAPRQARPSGQARAAVVLAVIRTRGSVRREAHVLVSGANGGSLTTAQGRNVTLTATGEQCAAPLSLDQAMGGLTIEATGGETSRCSGRCTFRTAASNAGVPSLGNGGR